MPCFLAPPLMRACCALAKVHLRLHCSSSVTGKGFTKGLQRVTGKWSISIRRGCAITTLGDFRGRRQGGVVGRCALVSSSVLISAGNEGALTNPHFWP